MCKRGSVHLDGGRSFLWDVCYHTPLAPTRKHRANSPQALPVWLAPDGVYHNVCHHNVSGSLTPRFRPYLIPSECIAALAYGPSAVCFLLHCSVASLRLAVSQRPVLWSPDFPLCLRTAIVFLHPSVNGGTRTLTAFRPPPSEDGVATKLHHVDITKYSVICRSLEPYDSDLSGTSS